ncbi:MAG: glyoxalase [Sphingomonadaceae bacterium]|nr:glyoxalase [Sphingomonadaceae bacterium]
MPPAVTLRAIVGFRIVTANLDRLIAFYRAIGFSVGARELIAAEEMQLLGLAGAGERQALSMGESRLDLDCFAEPGCPYPPDANAADLIFQHLALVTDNVRSALRRAAIAGATPISRDGPIELPQSAGGVTAVKFRDPDGHPLEFLQFPAGSNPTWPGRGMMGIDHSAISVSNIADSHRFYVDHALSEAKTSLNYGPTQVALDGLDDVKVDVVPMNPPTMPPHVELLGYRTPVGRPHAPLAANDLAATRIVWRAGTEALLRDPDGHLHQLMRSGRSPAGSSSPL